MTLPIFPLHTVLFPGRPLPLHVFEERYRSMVRLCLAEGSEFGVCLILDGTEALGPPATPAVVGTTATILNVEHLSDGRMILLAEGHRRFRIKELLHDEPYLSAQVDMLPSLQVAETDVAPIRETAENYARLLTRDFLGLPADPVNFLYFACSLLQIAAPKRQALLEMEDGPGLAAVLSQLLKREAALLEFVRTHKGAAGEPSLS